MSTLDYLEMPKLLNNYTSQVNELMVKVEKKLGEKAEFIAKKMNSNIEAQAFRRLKEERDHVLEVATMIDSMKILMNTMQDCVNNTGSDYWTMAMEGGKLKADLELAKEAYTKSLSDNQQMIKLNQSLTKKLKVGVLDR